VHDDLHLTTVFITHDEDEAHALADRVVVLDRGRIMQDGTAAAVAPMKPASPHVFADSVRSGL
jgi:ABC-type sulfate/molybdate transport systems ATPase subunit